MHCMQYATNIKLHVHTYAVGVADTAAREGSPHNVLHSSSNTRLAHTCRSTHVRVSAQYFSIHAFSLITSETAGKMANDHQNPLQLVKLRHISSQKLVYE